MQTAYVRWPTLAEARALLPGGTPAPTLGLPPGAAVSRWDLHQGWPILRVEPDVPPGTVYLFTLGDLAQQGSIPLPELDEWVSRAVRIVSRTLQRLLLALSLPLAWTAPQPDPSPDYTPERPAMTTPAPPRLDIPNGARVVHKHVANGQAAYMTHGVILAGPPTPQQLQAIADAAAAAWKAQLLTQLVDDVTYQECAVSHAIKEGAASAVAAGSGNGGGVGTTGPMSVAGVISLKTARAGRRYRGRMFLGPLRQDAVDADGRTLNAAYRTAIKTRWDAYAAAISAVGAAGGDPVVAILSHRGGHATPVIAAVVQPIIGSQRGRLR